VEVVKRFPLQALVALLAVLWFTPAAQALKPNPEVAQDVRDAAALKKLKATPNTVAVYAKGLCCMSCAIGIRKKVSGLEFIDRSRLNQGVELDAKTQLVTLAVNANQRVNPAAISKAVDAAGYVPVHLYMLRDDGQLATAALSLK